MSAQKAKLPKDLWKIEPARTALVVIDMQKAFMEDGLYGCVGASKLVPGLNKLIAMCRKTTIPVIFIKGNRREDMTDSHLMKDFTRPVADKQKQPFEGSQGSEFADGLDVQPGDYIVPKIRYNALAPGSSQLEPLLRGLGRDSIAICGVATDVCVGTTASTAMMIGFRVFFIGDLTATVTVERQKAALEAMNMHFAKVITLPEVEKEMLPFLNSVR